MNAELASKSGTLSVKEMKENCVRCGMNRVSRTKNLQRSNRHEERNSRRMKDACESGD